MKAKQYLEATTVFTDAYVSEVTRMYNGLLSQELTRNHFHQVAAAANSSNDDSFLTHLQSFTKLCCMEDQVKALKQLCKLFLSNAGEFRTRLFVELLFLPGSRPLHRQVVACISQLPTDDAEEVICYLQSKLKAVNDVSIISQVIISLSTPKANEVLSRICVQDIIGARLIIEALAMSIKQGVAVYEPSKEDIVTHSLLCRDLLDVHNAVTALHIILSAHRSHNPNGTSLLSCAYKEAEEAVLQALQTPGLLSKQGATVAASAFCLILFMRIASMRAVGEIFFAGLLCDNLMTSSSSLVEEASLIEELSSLALFHKICALHAVLTASPEQLLWQQLCSSNISQPILFIEAVLMKLIQAVLESNDIQHKSASIEVLALCLGILIHDNNKERDIHFLRNHIETIMSPLWSVFEIQKHQIVEHGSRVLRYLLMAFQPLGDTGALERIAANLLSIPVDNRTRYLPLSVFIDVCGAGILFEKNPAIIEESFHVMTEKSICAAVASMLTSLWKSVSENSREKTSPSSSAFLLDEQFWFPQTVAVLSSENEILRESLSLYVLPKLFSIAPTSAHTLILGGHLLERRSAVPGFIAALKTARRLQIVKGLPEFFAGKEQSFQKALRAALTHKSESVRVDAFEIVCGTKTVSSMPSDVELDSVLFFLELHMRCIGDHLKSKLSPLFKHLLTRVRREATSAAKARPPKLVDVNRLESWLQSVGTMALRSLYPGAPYERLRMALEILKIMLEVLGDFFNPRYRIQLPRDGCGFMPAEIAFNPFPPEIFSESTTHALLTVSVNSFDGIRQGALEFLSSFPSPLAGLSTTGQVAEVLKRAMALLCSPRMRESDAGALWLRFLFNVFAIGQNWTFDLLTKTVSEGGEEGRGSFCFIKSCCDLIQQSLEQGKHDLLAASRESLSHGPLLLLHYLIPLIDWRCPVYVPDLDDDAGAMLLCRIQGLLGEAVALALPPLAVPEADDATAEEDIVDDEDGYDDINTNEDASVQGPRAQLITCACWLTMKEAVLCMAELTLCVDVDVTLQLGLKVVELMCEIKHNGANDRASAALHDVCTKCSRTPTRTHIPRLLFDRLLRHLQRPDQSRRDILRRSAGLSLAVHTILKAESNLLAANKTVGQYAIECLLEIAATIPPPPEQPWPCVHAFNALRLIFLDKSLALETVQVCSEAFIACIKAMADARWEVRNAATLCYAALLIRITGFANVLHRSSAPGRKLITASDLFIRYPSLHEFLLKEFRKACDDQNGQQQQGGGMVHPSILPTLMLLARLRPPQFRHESTLSLIPLVCQCASVAPLQVRYLAARSMSCLVPDEDLWPLMQQLADSVAHAALRQGAVHCCIQTEEIVTTNTVHGWLLQLNVLLDVNVRAAAAASSSFSSPSSSPIVPAAVCTMLCKLLKPVLPLTRCSQCPCPPLAVELLRLTDLLCSMVPKREITDDIEDWCRIVRGHCWEAISTGRQEARLMRAAHERTPMMPWLNKEATQLYFRHLKPLNAGELQVALQSTKVEVRNSALKVLVKKLADARRRQDFSDLVQDEEMISLVLMEHIDKERDPKALRRSLQAFAMVLSQFFCEKVQQSITITEGRGRRLILHATSSPDPAARGYALQCCVRLTVMSPVSLLEQIGECGKPHQLQELRLAACCALKMSALLEAGRGLEGWRVAYLLLEDEDEEVRLQAAHAVALALGLEAADTLCVEYVERVAMEELCRQRGSSSVELKELLLEWSGLEDASVEMCPGSNKLFLSERENLHMEPQFLSQLAKECLEQLSALSFQNSAERA